MIPATAIGATLTLGYLFETSTFEAVCSGKYHNQATEYVNYDVPEDNSKRIIHRPEEYVIMAKNSKDDTCNIWVRPEQYETIAKNDKVEVTQKLSAYGPYYSAVKKL